MKNCKMVYKMAKTSKKVNKLTNKNNKNKREEILLFNLVYKNSMI